MTYLEIVNDVLRRLREPAVSSVPDTEYSQMIGTLVNDAKRDVENAHTWNALRSLVNVTSVAGTQQYTLTGSGDRFVVDFVADSTGAELIKAPVSWVDMMTLQHTDQGTPSHYCFTGVDTNGDSKVKFFKIPSGAVTYYFWLFIPQTSLTNNADACLVPGYLVAMNAYARAIAERGEDSGNLSSEAYQLYQKSLGEAIAIERNRYEEQINWEAV